MYDRYEQLLYPFSQKEWMGEGGSERVEGRAGPWGGWVFSVTAEKRFFNYALSATIEIQRTASVRR